MALPNFDYYPKTNPPYDPYVKEIQEKLNYIRISRVTLNRGIEGKPYNWPYLTPDGQYGPLTAQVVRQFQLARGITPASGILGRTTAHFIEDAHRSGAIHNWNIQDIQQKLNYVCRLNIAEDGLWGEESKGALRIFRSQYGVPAMYGSNGSNLDVHVVQKLNEVYGRGSRLRQNFVTFETIAEKFVSPLAGTLNNISELALKQIEKLNEKAISKNDIKSIVKSMFNKPNVEEMRNKIVKGVWDELKKQARGNTNVINWKNDKRTVQNVESIKDAQKQISTGRLSKNVMNSVDETLSKQVTDKCIKELEDARIDKKITDSVAKLTGKTPKVNVGHIFKAISLIPLFIHTLELFSCWQQGKPLVEPLKKIAKDLVSIAVGIIITQVVTYLVGLLGITGGIAVLTIIGVGIIVGLVLSFFFPDWEKKCADRFVDWIYSLVSSVKSTLSRSTYTLVPTRSVGFVIQPK